MSAHDPARYAENLELFNRFNEPLLRQAMASLALAPGTKGADVGCGVGNATRWPAELVGPTGAVTGVDPSADFRAIARDKTEEENVEFTAGTLAELPFPDESLDFVWCADVLWPGPTDKGCPVSDGREGLREIVRVLRPSGTASCSTRCLLLPGQPRCRCPAG